MPTLPRGAQIRRRVWYAINRFPDDFRLLADVETHGAGGVTVVEQTIAAGRCRLRSVGGGSEREIAGRLGWNAPAICELPFVLDVDASMRLVINGDRYEIGPPGPVGWEAVVKMVVVQRMSEG